MIDFYGGTSPPENGEKIRPINVEANSHQWFEFGARKLICCKNCGIVKRLDGKNSPCKGVVKVGLRSLHNER